MSERTPPLPELLPREDVATGSGSRAKDYPIEITRAVKDQIFAGISELLAKETSSAGRETKRRVLAIKRPTAAVATETALPPGGEAEETGALSISEKQWGNGAWRYPVDRRSSLKLTVFRDLHRQGFVITDGVKFGADYLVYQGDPAVYHSNFQVQVLDSEVGISGRHLMALSRVARGAKKR